MDSQDASEVPLNTSVSELRRIIDTLLDHLAESGDDLQLGHDYYWSLPAEARRKVREEPHDLTVGQLSDDLANLRQMVARDEPLAYGLVWVGELLRTLGEDQIV